jgi:hypothetical protein
MFKHIVRRMVVAWGVSYQSVRRLASWWRGLTEIQQRRLAWRSSLYLNLLAFAIALAIAVVLQNRVDNATEAARYYEDVFREHEHTIQHAQMLEAVAVLTDVGEGRTRLRDLAEMRAQALISRFVSADRPANVAEKICPLCPHTRNVGTLGPYWEEKLVDNPTAFDSMRQALRDASTARYYRTESELRDAAMAMSRWTLLRNVCACAYIFVQSLAILASSRAERPGD